MIKTYNGRFVPKGDTEANWNKAVGFIPLDKEIIIYKKDTNHSTPRIKIGDGVTVIQKLPFISSGGGEVDLSIIQSMIDEKGEILIEYVDNAVAAIQDQIAELEGRVTTVTFNIGTRNKEIEFERLLGMTKIDWGDGTIDCNLNHIYVDAGRYDCKIYDLTELYFATYGPPDQWIMQGVENVIATKIGKTVTTIGGLYKTNISNLEIPDNVTTIKSYAFYYCDRLTSVVIGDGVTSIGDYAFSMCSYLTSIVIPDSVTSIGSSAFRFCDRLTSVVIGSGVTSIGGNAFQYCKNLKDVYITDLAAWCNILFANAFANPLDYRSNLYVNNKLLTELVIPYSATSIGDYAFAGCDRLTSVAIPDSVTSIGDYALYGCDGLTSIEIPNSVTGIGNSAFEDCSGLTSVVIGNSVTSIGDDVFDNCSSLTNVTFKNVNPISYNFWFYNLKSLTHIYVPYGCAEIYKTQWAESEFFDPESDAPILDKIVESDREAMMSDLDAVKASIPTNIENNVKMGTVQQVADNGYEEGFNFSGKNTNAETLDASLSAVQPYGATGKYAVSLGGATSAQGSRSIAINNKTIAKGDESFAQGYCSVALGGSSVATGNATTAAGQGAYAGGIHTVALGDGSYAIGYHSIAKGLYSHAEGSNTQANKQSAHSEGGDTIADGEYSHAEGGNTQAAGMYAHSEGVNTLASNRCAHAQGHATVASGDGSHAQGNYTIAEGNYSHAGGSFTRAGQDYQTVIGQFNDNKTNTLFEIGNGLTEDVIDIDGNIIIKNRSNAFEALKDGRAKVYGAPIEDNDVVRKQDILTGGAISGNLSIGGDLTVAGTTTTQDTETVLVKNNIVVTNSDGLELIEPGGFAIKTDETNAYGIMYDPNGDGVKIGLGAFDENGKFEYIEGEDQFLATRADTIVDGHTVVWDSEANQFVDSGTDHSEYVKFTDYANQNTAGVAKVFPGNHGLNVTSGILIIRPANETEIEAQTDAYKPITPATTSKATKEGFVNSKVEWTDEDKAKACETIGAVKKNSSKSILYGTNSAGVETTVAWEANTAKSHTVLRRTGNGGAVVSLNVEKETADGKVDVNSLATPKSYVDDNFVGKVTTTGASRVYTVSGNGTQGTINYNFATPLSDWIAGWSTGGVMRMNDPIGNLDGVNKQYAENNFVAKKDTTDHPTAGKVAKWGLDGKIYTNDPVNPTHCVNLQFAEDNFVPKDKVSSNGVYGKSGGNEILYSISQWGAGGGEDTIARRTNKGGLRVVLDETNDKPEEMATPRGWVEDNFVAKPTDTSGFNRVVGVNTNNVNITYKVQYPNYNYDEAGVASRIGIPYMERGQLSCSIPTSDYSAANKKYVDDLIAGLVTRIEALEAK